jgi:predicted metal-dependent phosphoesterase TrpH/glycosyltransferase involved in cell wall biosynthesis
VQLRICLVTPFSWSKPHAVNEHVAGAAAALRRRGHVVTVLAPSHRISDLVAGRRALERGIAGEEVVAIGTAIPVSRTSGMGVPVAVRANLAAALRQGFDVVHGFEPGLPSLSYLALLAAKTLTAATFISPERVSYLPRKTQRARLLARVDRLLATSTRTAEAAAARFAGDYELIPLGVDTERFTPGRKTQSIVLETTVESVSRTRAALRALRDLDGWELTLVKTARLAGRPAIPLSLRSRTHVRTVRRPSTRAEVLSPAAIFVPAAGGSERLRLDAMAAGCAIVDPPASDEQPELVAAAIARLGESEALRDRLGGEARQGAEKQSFDRLAERLESVYLGIGGRRRRARSSGDPLADREWIIADLHMHTNWSHDCAVEPLALVEHAEHEGLGAIAVTDHNVFGGALEAAELAADRELIVIPGEEMKTDGQGEVIGLFLREEIPKGLSFADTIAAIREQDGIVYLPHPFDRMHSIPTPETLHRHLADIDVLEVYNARLLFEAYNEEALRFARKYRLPQGAGSDAHVLQGVGTGALRMRRFDDPEEFLLALQTADVLRRPKSLAYLQSLKWVAQVKEKAR